MVEKVHSHLNVIDHSLYMPFLLKLHYLAYMLQIKIFYKKKFADNLGPKHGPQFEKHFASQIFRLFSWHISRPDKLASL